MRLPLSPLHWRFSCTNMSFKYVAFIVATAAAVKSWLFIGAELRLFSWDVVKEVNFILAARRDCRRRSDVCSLPAPQDAVIQSMVLPSEWYDMRTTSGEIKLCTYKPGNRTSARPRFSFFYIASKKTPQ